MNIQQQWVPESLTKEQCWEALKKDLHRGDRVGTPRKIHWHPHPAGKTCTEECRVVMLSDIEEDL